uniref:Uncharacterized protein n=1 Tax=Plectus sambesii TaxID=2011161 RepID=A0A914V3X8_9BILA
MKLNYRFSNLLGTVYKQGNVQFTSDGNTVISPVGNKVTLYDLKNHLSETLPIESILNIAVVALNPAGTHLLLINDGGEALYVSLISKTILHRHRFHKRVKDVRFSPDGR